MSKRLAKEMEAYAGSYPTIAPVSFRSKRIIGDERSQEIHVEATWRAETFVNRL